MVACAVLCVVVAGCGAAPAPWPVRAHTENWAYADGCNGARTARGLVAATLVRAWVTYGEANCGAYGIGNALALCHAGGAAACTVLQYADTDRVFPGADPGGLLGLAPESWYLHAPGAPPGAATRITTASTPYGTGHLMNQNGTTSGCTRTPCSYQAWWREHLRTSLPAGVDGLFMDDQEPYLPLFGLNSPWSREPEAAQPVSAGGTPQSGEPAPPATLVDAEHSLQSAHTAMSRALAAYQVQFDNAIPDCGNPSENAFGFGPTGSLLGGPVVGLVAEGCPVGFAAGGIAALTTHYTQLLDDIGYVERHGSGAVVLRSEACAGDPDQRRWRLVAEATELLGYQPGRLVAWPDLEQPRSPGTPQCPRATDDLAVWPESGIYPVEPRQTMGSPSGAGCLQAAATYRLAPGVIDPCTSGGARSLEIPVAEVSGASGIRSGLFRREFRRCADRGTSFGPCAAIVNTTDRAVTVRRSWLQGAYSFVIGLVGGDVQSGGSVDLRAQPFAAGSASAAVPAGSALLLAG